VNYQVVFGSTASKINTNWAVDEIFEDEPPEILHGIDSSR
jgi:hypothetical protein